MRNAETILNIIRKRGQRGLPIQDAYRLLYQRDLYLRAYGKLYRNKGAMTEGATPETVDGMSLEKIETIINLLRNERYRWIPVRRIFIPKKNAKTKLRPLGLPSWSDKLLQEVIRSILEAYYEPQFSEHSHGFRPKRGCHTALREVMQKGGGTKWFIEGDLCACFDKIDHSILLNILQESFHDNRFIRLLSGLLKAGYLEDWKCARAYKRKAQTMPSQDPNDPNFRRLWYVRYADDFLLGLIGPKNEAMEIKHKISELLSKDLKLELNAEKTLVTHARNQKAKFLGYEIHTLHEDSKQDHRGWRCINGNIGLRIPQQVQKEKCAKYMKHGKPKHMPQQAIDAAYSTVSQYQAEYRGIAQYYRMAYNLHTLNKLKYVMEVSLVKTLANKYKTTCPKIYKRYNAKIMTEGGERKVLLVKVEREAPKKPLITLGE